MSKKRVVLAITLAVIWGYVAALWASIGHFLLGAPDVAPIAAPAAALVTLAWRLRPVPQRAQRASRLGEEPLKA
jgi:hypothetical protein